jgi:hypothetical protein
MRALADAPEAFGSSLGEWEAADERRWRQRLDDVPFNVIAISDGLPVGQASCTAADEDGCVRLISMWVAPGAMRIRVRTDRHSPWSLPTPRRGTAVTESRKVHLERLVRTLAV